MGTVMAELIEIPALERKWEDSSRISVNFNTLNFFTYKFYMKSVDTLADLQKDLPNIYFAILRLGNSFFYIHKGTLHPFDFERSLKSVDMISLKNRKVVYYLDILGREKIYIGDTAEHLEILSPETHFKLSDTVIINKDTISTYCLPEYEKYYNKFCGVSITKDFSNISKEYFLRLINFSFNNKVGLGDFLSITSNVRGIHNIIVLPLTHNKKHMASIKSLIKYTFKNMTHKKEIHLYHLNGVYYDTAGVKTDKTRQQAETYVNLLNI